MGRPPPPAPEGSETSTIASFDDLGIDHRLRQALSDIGYETPTPIQAETIPPLLSGRDLVGLAQTGTGKTAAFALPILQNLDLRLTAPQALVLAPTRELVIQVAEAFQRYATNLPGFHVLPIYGGQSYGPQLHGLRRGAHVVVGTPGRLIDHLGKRSLDLSALRTLILDEADEMLRMGFIEDIQAILTSVPDRRQTALFSATMPPAIRKISRDYLRDPAEITVKNKTTTAALTRQRYWPVSGLHKLDALTRILEVEPFTAMIVFVRTKQATEDLATKLRARGFDAAAINGDIPQPQRERTIGQLRDGTLDILVATDVAARGLDVQRISHVLNYDIPHDAEAYVHRIGRTGRAGRSGEAILFVAPRERHLVRAIEKATRQTITPMELPSVQDVNHQRIARFSQSITDALASEDLGMFQDLVEEYEQTHNVPAVEIAAALARIVQGDRPLLLETGHPAPAPTPSGPPALYQVSVGRAHRVRPGALVGALANEGGLDSRQIGRIDIRADHSLVELPADLPAETLDRLQQTKVAGHALRIRRADADAEARSAPAGRTAPGNKKKPRHKKSTAPAGSSYSRPGRRHG